MLAEQLSKQQGIPFQGFMGGSLNGISQPSSAYAGSGGALNTLRQALVHSVLNPSNNQASQILNTETEIAQNLTRMPLASRIRAIRSQGVALNPTQATLPLIPAEQLGLQPQTTLVPDMNDLAIDPQVLATELQQVNAGQMPLVGKKDESDDDIHPFGPVGNKSPVPPAYGNTAEEDVRAREQLGVMTALPSAPSSRQSEREKRAEDVSIARQRGNITGDLRQRLSEEQGGISLYKAVALSTTQGTPTHKPSSRHLDADWDYKEEGKGHSSSLPHENPYDIKTWTSARLKSYRNDPYFHLKVSKRPGTKAERQALMTSGQDKDRIKQKHMDMYIQGEIDRRQTENKRKLDYGSQRHGEAPAYKKEGDAPPKWSDHETAYQHPRGIGPKVKLMIKKPGTTGPAQPSSAPPASRIASGPQM